MSLKVSIRMHQSLWSIHELIVSIVIGNFCATVLHHNLAVINAQIRARLALAAWPQALKQGIVHMFPSMVNGRPGCVSLADTVSKDFERTELTMSLGGLDVHDSDVSLICSSFPIKLKSLKLIFESCGRITDRGLGCVDYWFGRFPLPVGFLACQCLRSSLRAR